MKRNIVFLFVMSCVLAACQTAPEPVEYVEYADNIDVGYQTVVVPACTDSVTDDASVSMIKYSVPRDGDLTLETRHHVIQIQGAPNTAYEYRVWAGDKGYDNNPDLIVNDDNIMVLQANN